MCGVQSAEDACRGAKPPDPLQRSWSTSRSACSSGSSWKVPVCVALTATLRSSDCTQSGKTRRVLLAVAMSLPFESWTVPSAKAARLPGFETIPTAVSWPVSAITGRR
jgi:hypothetical protein